MIDLTDLCAAKVIYSSVGSAVLGVAGDDTCFQSGQFSTKESSLACLCASERFDRGCSTVFSDCTCSTKDLCLWSTNAHVSADLFLVSCAFRRQTGCTWSTKESVSCSTCSPRSCRARAAASTSSFASSGALISGPRASVTSGSSTSPTCEQSAHSMMLAGCVTCGRVLSHSHAFPTHGETCREFVSARCLLTCMPRPGYCAGRSRSTRLLEKLWHVNPPTSWQYVAGSSYSLVGIVWNLCGFLGTFTPPHPLPR